MSYNPVKCLHPKLVRNKYTNELICVPCGKCNACLSQVSSTWVSRLREESTCHPYTIFGTLTYTDDNLPLCNVLTYESRSETFQESLEKSSSYIQYCNYNVPCFNIKDIQSFFKLIRQQIARNHGTQREFQIRYFLASEIGPTTYRPHFHYLLWFDSPELVPRIKEYIYKAWQSKNSCSSLSDFLRRNKTVFIHGKAESYVARYLYKSPDLPSIFSEKPFRPFHVQSINPPIGAIRIFKNILQGLSLDDIDSITLHRCTTGESVVVPLWRGLENRLFPKCLSFNFISHGDRRILYTISRQCSSGGQDEFPEDYSFESFKKWLLPKWFSSDYSIKLLRKVCRYSESEMYINGKFCGFESELFQPILRTLRRIFGCSRQFLSLSCTLQRTSEDLLASIEAYYSRKEYLSLLEQMRLQEYLSSCIRKDVSLQFYPFLVDRLFYENLRKLPFKTYVGYLEQFGLGKLGDYAFIDSNSLFYAKRKSLSDKIVFDSRKQRIKKDYLANHPDAYLNQYYSLKPFVL